MKKYIERNIFFKPQMATLRVLHWKNEDFKNKKMSFGNILEGKEKLSLIKKNI